jgi:hemolysin activation/secretion protein
VLQRSSRSNLYWTLQLNRTHVNDRLEAAQIVNPRDLDAIAGILNGNQLGLPIIGGDIAGSLTLSSGQLKIHDASALATDIATTRAQGRFNKLNYSLDYSRDLIPNTSLFASLSGQLADRNLDSSQKLSIGGPSSVRGYDVGTVSADTGYQLKLEGRLSTDALPGRTQLFLFQDSTWVAVNQKPWTSAQNHSSLSAVGLGIRWRDADGWSAVGEIGTPSGARPFQNPYATKVRSWVSVMKSY